VSALNSLHQAQLDPVLFREVTIGVQHALVVEDALGIWVGDQIALREWVATGPAGRGHYTGQWIVRRVTGRQSGGGETGVLPGFSVLSLNNAAENEFATSHLKKEITQAEREGILPARFFELKAAAERRKREQQRKTVTEAG
jgi:hypothetical protein